MAMEFLQPHNKEMVLVEPEETVEEALIGRRARRTAEGDGGAVNGDDLSSSDEEHVNNDKPNNNVNFDWNEGIEDFKTDFVKVLNGVVNSDHETGNPEKEILSGGGCLPSSLGQNSLNEMGNAKGEILSPPSLGRDSESSASVRKGSENERITEEVEEEVVELEFFDTAAVDKLHTHNAYCPNCSSRITKVVLRRVKRERRISVETADPHDQKLDLLGCFSCFSVFVRIGKKLNPFPIFGHGETNSTEIAGEPHLSNTNSVSSGSATVGGNPVVNEGDDCRIPIEDPRPSPTLNLSGTRRPVLSVEVKDSKSLEIVKCIVYGGLIESITSLSVVSSAAASDADTMKIVALGVANLIGGLFVICQNLVDLKYIVGGGSNLRDQTDQYGELLGQRKHFLIHFTFALLSYFIFGLIPPVVYGFTFRKSNDKDYKLIAVALTSLLCIVILATAKAYTRRANKFSKYFKTVMSYVIAAGMASGVGYAAGHLIKRLMDDLGWFDSKPAPSLFSPQMISQNSAWASY